MSEITLPGITFGANKDTSSGTSGRNPWVDGIFYEAQWGNAFHTAFRSSKPAYNYYFLKPSDIEKNSLKTEFTSKIEEKTNTKFWLKDRGTQGIESPHPNSSLIFKTALQPVADVSNLRIREAKEFSRANVVIANAHINFGFLGSHESMINGETGKPQSLPLIFDYDYNTYKNDIEKKNIQPGSALRAVLIHEIGHGLGLSHPHDSGIGFQASGVFPGLVPFDTAGHYGNGLQGMTQQAYTIMSYKRGYTNPTITDTKEQSIDNTATPMALDVAALQIKYGTNRKTRKGNTTYNLNPNYWQCIYDAGGNDWIKAKTYRDEAGNIRDAIINLRPAEMNAVKPSDGSPMERYLFGHGKALDTALTTLISQETSMIGAPLGMGVVAAGKIAAVLSNESTLKQFKKEGYFKRFKNLGKLLEKLQKKNISPLQLTTAIHQTDFYENFENDISLNKQKAGLPEDFYDIVGSLLSNGALFKSIINGGSNNEENKRQEKFYKASFINESFNQSFPEKAGDIKSLTKRHFEREKRIASFEADLKEEQQRLMARSFKGIGGYPMFYSGKNGGLTIAAGVLIENAQGGDGNDMITGNAENNILKGGRGNDVLDGYFGRDKLYGGPGSDTFSYENIDDSPAAKNSTASDLILDFSPEDKVSFKPLRIKANASNWDPRLKSLADQYQLKYLGSKSFDGKPGRLRFDNEQLTFDADGDMSADMIIRMPGVDHITKSQILM